jgi:NAD(P)-dependent dehydrogenase (short-subunit alcohol dehydrogenase family)
MSSQPSVRRLADQLHQRFAKIDVLMNNAGAIFARRELTAEGIERTFATNHLGAFLLTNLALDLVRASSAGRIVNVVSELYPSQLDFDNLQGEKSYGFLNAYARSKLENIVFTFDLARRLAGTGITVNCVSPGPGRTRFGDNMTGLPSLFPLLAKRLFPSPEKGARTMIYLASSAELADISGRFFMRQRPKATKPVTRHAAIAARLWRISADLVGLSDFELPKQAAGGLPTKPLAVPA